MVRQEVTQPAWSAGGIAQGPPLDLALVPQGGDPIEVDALAGTRIWRARSFGPTFEVRLPSGASLEPGWYAATAIVDGRSGDVCGPRLFAPDASGDYSESRVVALERRGDAFEACFELPWAVRALRFQPSRSPCEFACEGVRIVRIPAPGPARRIAHLAKGFGTLATRVAGVRLGVRRLRERWRDRLVRFVDQAPPVDLPRRKRLVLADIDRNGIGVEIGPSHDPIAPKREGFRTHVIDHMSRAQLLEKYRDHPIALDGIEEVDFVWRGEAYRELTGASKHYDWVIASNVIEHTPDLIGFLADCEAILKDSGVLCLVVPDKRYIFDRFRPLTGLARVIDSHEAGCRTHSAGAVAEHYMSVAGKGHRLGWTAQAQGSYAFIHGASEARQVMRSAREGGAYLDVHNWCFVPHSFRLLLEDLHALGLTRLRETGFHATSGCEFHVTLSAKGRGPGLSRLEMLRAVDAELAEADSKGLFTQVLRRFLRMGSSEGRA